MKETSKTRGNITELETAAALVRRNCGICIPYGDRSRYDLVADVDGKFLRIQCKSSHTADGGRSFSFKTCSVNYVDGKRAHVGYSPEDVDYFATVFNNKCYLYPVTDESMMLKTLRIEPTVNGQSSGITWAKDYTIDVVLSRIRGKMIREQHRRDKEANSNKG